MLPFPTLADPRLLVRVVEQVAGGNRRPRGLTEALDVEPRAVEGAVRAARWLGFLRPGDDLVLSADGLRLVYAGARRGRVYAEVVRAHPFLAPHLPTRGPLDVVALTAAVSAADPELSPVAARRRAGVLRALAEPGLKVRLPPTSGVQLGLVFAEAPRAGRPPADLRAGLEDNPDVYLVVLRALLDHGELTTAELRATLDAAGADTCPLGAYVAAAVRRGDATRVGDRLVVSRGALDRREVAGSAVTVALSDPAFREWIAVAREGPAPATRHRLWADRFFRPGTVDTNLERLLFGRPLGSLPVAGDNGPALPAGATPFLELPPRGPVVFAVPSSLGELAGGVTAVNRALRLQHMEPSGVRPPSVTSPRAVVHGGLFSPGEMPARTLADGVSLRQRLLRHTPAAVLLVAAAISERRRRLTLGMRRGGIRIETSRRPARDFHQVVGALAAAGGWDVVTGADGPDWGAAAQALVGAGVLTTVGPRLTVEEGLFFRLQTDPEHRHLWDLLQPWVAAVADAAVPPLSG